jgi:syntaxin 1B/2/3
LQYNEQVNRPTQLQHNDSEYSQEVDPTFSSPLNTHQNIPHTDVPIQQAYGQAPSQQHGAQPLSREDYLSRIEGTKQRIGQLTSDIQAIASIHQRMLSSPDNRSSSELESIVSQTQIRNTQIKDEIKFLERDASRAGNDSFKKTQVESLKRTFKSQLDDFQREESDYSKRYREAIGRQYRIINPEATEAEVHEASNADWGDEGIFTQAVS